jgi:hypothetical protein
MTGPSVTTYAETAALYHVLNEDRDAAIDVVLAMTPTERAMFAHQLDELRSMLTDRFGNDVA